MFRSFRNTGFHLTFANGWTVSVQWGPGTYSDHYESSYTHQNPAPHSTAWSSKTAEVAVISKAGDVQEPVGYQTPEQVAAIIAEVAART